LYTPNPNAATLTSAAKTTTGGKLTVAVSETPVFVSN
jgi:hypothetical protein